MQKEWPEILITALGVAKSDPLREAEQFGIYAVEDLELDRRRFQMLAGRAFDYLKVLQENRELRETSTSVSTLEPTPSASAVPAAADGGPSLRMLRFPRVFRQFDNVDALLARVVESVADAAAVTRVGIFRRFGKGIVIDSAPACAVCRKRTRWNSASATRWCAGSNCTRI